MRKTILTALALALCCAAAAATAIAAGTPSVTTGPASGQTDNTATLSGTVNPNGATTSYAFQYGTTAGYGLQTAYASAGTGSTGQNVTSNVTGLTPGTTYHYRIIARNASGTSAGSDMTFKTTGTAPAPKTPPSATTGAASGATSHGVQLNGTVNPNGTAASYWFEYGTSTVYGVQTTPKSTGTAPTPVTASLSGLQAGITYHFRLVASNSNGTSVGADRTFTTPGTKPAGRTNPRSVTASTTPKRARGIPAVFTTTGKVVLPGRLSAVQRRDACSGKVLIQFQAGPKYKRTISARRVGLSKRCTYSSRVKFRIKGRVVGGKLRVRVQFLGNAALNPRRARDQFVTA